MGGRAARVLKAPYGWPWPHAAAHGRPRLPTATHGCPRLDDSPGLLGLFWVSFGPALSFFWASSAPPLGLFCGSIGRGGQPCLPASNSTRPASQPQPGSERAKHQTRQPSNFLPSTNQLANQPQPTARRTSLSQPAPTGQAANQLPANHEPPTNPLPIDKRISAARVVIHVVIGHCVPV